MKNEYLAIQIARELRKNQTPSELIFWEKVRNRRFKDYKFLRQHPIFYRYANKDKFFIADFYCRELNLVIEIDGGIHESQELYDQIRSEILLDQRDLRIIRFKNDEILNDINNVFRRLSDFIILTPVPSVPRLRRAMNREGCSDSSERGELTSNINNLLRKFDE